jgi:hypothetical protein
MAKENERHAIAQALADNRASFVTSIPSSATTTAVTIGRRLAIYNRSARGGAPKRKQAPQSPGEPAYRDPQ